jgi:hypothetical protein
VRWSAAASSMAAAVRQPNSRTAVMFAVPYTMVYNSIATHFNKYSGI